MSPDAEITPKPVLDDTHVRSPRRYFLLSTFFAAIGRNAYYVGALWILAVSGGNAGVIALFLGLGSISEFLASAPAGYLVDRFDRRYLCMASDVVRMLILLITSAALFLGESDYALYGSVIIYAIADRVYLTASSAIVPSIAQLGSLVSFNSRAYIAMQAGNMLAAIVAGWLLDAVPQVLCFFLAAGTFAMSAVSMCRVAICYSPVPVDHPHPAQAPAQTSTAEGAARMAPFLLVSYVLIYAMGMLISALVSKFVQQELHGSSIDFGRLEFYWAAGAVISMLILMFRRFSAADGRSIPVIVVLSGAATAAFHVIQSIDMAFVLMAALGAAYNLSRVLIDVEIQRLVASAKLGRAKGRMHVVCMGFSLLLYAGLAISGDAIRPSTAFFIFGSGTIACIAFGYALKMARQFSSRWGMPS